MTTYFYCLEIEGFGNFPISYENEERIRLGKLPFSKSKILIDNLKQKIENNLKEIINDANVLDLHYLNFFFGKSFTYLIIEFDSELHEDIEKYIRKDENPSFSNDILMIFEDMNDIITISYYMADLFLNSNIEKHIEEEIIREIKSKNLEYNPNLSFKIIGLYSFVLELSSQYDLNYVNLIKSSIKSFFDENFPRLLERIPINVLKFNFYSIFQKDKPFSLENFCHTLLSNLSKDIGILYSNYNILLELFRSHLIDYDNPMLSYDQKTLEKLEGYLRDLKNKFFIYNPILFQWRFDVLIFKHETDSNTERLESYQPYIQNILYDKERLIHSLKLLKEELFLSINKVNQLKQKKEDLIKKYTRNELEERLKNIKNESEFQDILKDILNDLGFFDIRINCGRRGHKEFGKDIVFSYRNKFRSIEYDAIVVKTGKIDQPEGRDIHNYIKDIIRKGSDALEIPFIDEKGIPFPITRVFIATNEGITDDAKTSIRAKIEGNVFFIEKDTLLSLF